MSQINVSQPNTQSLQVSLQAYKSVISDYALRAKQAEELTTVLLTEKIPKDEFIGMVVNKIEQHVEARGIERSTQYLGLIQATTMALTELQKTQPSSDLVEIIKALTLATGAQ